MSALPAEQPLEIDTARIYQLPPREDVPNPILEATPEAYQPPPDVILNRPKAKRQRKTKAPGKKRGRPAAAKAPIEPLAPPAQPAPTPQTVVAAPPRDPFFSKPVSFTAGWAVAAMMFALAVGAAIGFWAIR